MNVTVVYTTDAMQDSVPVALPAGATAAEAIRRSRLADVWGLHLATIAIAVYGRTVTPDTRLADGDRVELLRPISADPKEARRRRAAARASSTVQTGKRR